MIRNYIIIGVVLALSALSVAYFKQRSTLIVTKKNLADATAVIEKAKIVSNIHRAHTVRLEKENAELQKAYNEILLLEGGHAPLSDYLRRGAGIVWQ